MLDMLKLDEQHRHRHDQAAHVAIADAVRDRDPELAATRSREHLAAVRSSVA